MRRPYRSVTKALAGFLLGFVICMILAGMAAAIIHA